MTLQPPLTNFLQETLIFSFEKRLIWKIAILKHLFNVTQPKRIGVFGNILSKYACWFYCLCSTAWAEIMMSIFVTLHYMRNIVIQTLLWIPSFNTAVYLVYVTPSKASLCVRKPSKSRNYLLDMLMGRGSIRCTGWRYSLSCMAVSMAWRCLGADSPDTCKYIMDMLRHTHTHMHTEYPWKSKNLKMCWIRAKRTMLGVHLEAVSDVSTGSAFDTVTVCVMQQWLKIATSILPFLVIFVFFHVLALYCSWLDLKWNRRWG